MQHLWTEWIVVCGGGVLWIEIMKCCLIKINCSFFFLVLSIADTLLRICFVRWNCKTCFVALWVLRSRYLIMLARSLDVWTWTVLFKFCIEKNDCFDWFNFILRPVSSYGHPHMMSLFASKVNYYMHNLCID